jgi:hypothetical protein
MNLTQAISKYYGVTIPFEPDDGRMHAFKIDPFRLGFVIGFADCAAFGCWSDGECATFCNGRAQWIRIDRQAPVVSREGAFERLIVSLAKAQYEQSGGLTVEENDRLKVAVAAVEENS